MSGCPNRRETVLHGVTEIPNPRTLIQRKNVQPEVIAFYKRAEQKFSSGGVQQYVCGRFGRGDSNVASAAFIKSKCLSYLNGSTSRLANGAFLIDSDSFVI